MMSATDLTHQYSAASPAEKLRIISDRLLGLAGPDRDAFLHHVLLDRDLPAKRHAVSVLLTETEIALACARQLLVAVDPRDHLQTLRYYGALVIEKAGCALDPRETIPLLLASYDRNDYRDTTHQIQMALRATFMVPIETILGALSAWPDDKREEISSGLRRASALDFEKMYRSYQLTHRKRRATR